MAENDSGIVGMTRGDEYPLKNCRVLNNLLIRNYVTADNVTRGADLILYMEPDAKARAEVGQLADYNVYADNSWIPLMRHDWNNDNTLAQWQQQFGQDKHSTANDRRLLPLRHQLQAVDSRGARRGRSPAGRGEADLATSEPQAGRLPMDPMAGKLCEMKRPACPPIVSTGQRPYTPGAR